MRFVRVAAVCAAGLMLATPAWADGAKPEEMLKMRQGLWQAVKTSFGPLGAIAKGEAQMGPQTAQQAETLAALARIVPMGFAPGSEKLPGARTKPEAWTDAAFSGGVTNFQAETAKLAEAARDGQADAVKKQAGAVAKLCKSCHDNFRAD